MFGGGGGLMQTMATGAAFGAGSEIAHQGVRAMMGGGGGHGGHSEPAQQQQAAAPMEYAQEQQMPAQQQQQQENPCMGFNQNLLTCLQQNRGEINICQNYMDMLNQCERDQSFRMNNYQ